MNVDGAGWAHKINYERLESEPAEKRPRMPRMAAMGFYLALSRADRRLRRQRRDDGRDSGTVTINQGEL